MGMIFHSLGTGCVMSKRKKNIGVGGFFSHNAPCLFHWGKMKFYGN